MGQYHKPVSIEAAEGIEPHLMGCGLKTGEQLYTTPGTAHAMAALVSVRTGNGPADLAQSTIVGRWAGTRVLVQGDYAEDDDIPGWTGPRLSELYGAVGYEVEEPTLERTVEHHQQTNINGAAPGTKRHQAEVLSIFKENLANHRAFLRDHPGHPTFADIGQAAADFLEGACSVRYCGDGWRTQVKVRQTAQLGPDGVAVYAMAKTDPETLAYYGRCGIEPPHWQRVPRGGQWHGLRDDEIDQGQARLFVDLDTMEYLDPVAFGDVPTLGGIVNGQYGGAASALFCALVHPERRGGGDIPVSSSDHKGAGGKTGGWKGATGFVGRWRGHRIVGVSEFRSGDFPSVDDVKAAGTDVSRHAQRYLAAIKDW